MTVSSRRESVESLEPRRLFSVPTGFTETTVASGMSSVTSMAVAPDGRVFVTEQATGKIRVVKNDKLLTAAFATVPTVQSEAANGLLGIAFDPNFASNGFVYVRWTSSAGGSHDVISRFKAAGDVATGGRTDLVSLPGPAEFHQGGMIGFGADGKLYVPTGDEGMPALAQDLTNVHGKVLRFNADGSIPTDNPYYNTAAGINRAIWASGLRNPFMFDVQPGTGRMYINDVGEATWEEVNLGSAGANYGWPGIEGPQAGQSAPAGYADPVYAYKHGTGDNAASITGGVFYAGNQFPSSYNGRYFFTDFTGTWIKTLDPSNPAGTVQPFGAKFSNPIDLKRGMDGSLYVLNYSGGKLVKIQYTAGTAPNIVTSPQPQTVPVGQPATFTVQAGGTGTLSYQWQRNGVNIPGATAASYTIAAAAATDNGAAFRAVVTNATGSATSAAAVLTVLASQYPVPVITAPDGGFLYTAGQTVTFAGSVSDPEDGDLSAANLNWAVTFHHDTHEHPFLASISGVAGGSFTVPAVGETSSNVWYRIELTATDSSGLTRTTYQDVFPVKAAVTLAASVGGAAMTGFGLTLDGQPVTTGYAFTGVAGLERALGAAASQTVNGVAYDFVGWSDGGDATHTVSTPSAATTYTAEYKVRATVPTAGPTAELVNAATDQKIATLTDGYVIDMGQTGTRLNIQVLPVGTAGSIAFRIDGADVKTETSAPYTIGGDAGVGQFNDWTPPVGTHTLQVVQYSGAGGTGTVQGTTTLTFTALAPTTVPPPPVSPPPVSPPSTTPTLVSVRASADAYGLNGPSAGTNFGASGELQARLSSIAGSWREAFLRFDLTTVASADQITSAAVRLTGRLSQAGSVTLGLFPVTGGTGWTEAGLTWNNKPTSGTTAVGATKTLTNTANAAFDFDLTSYLKQQKAVGTTTVNLALKATNYTTPYAVFASDEAASGRPELRVTQQGTVSPPPVSPPPVSPPTTTPTTVSLRASADAYALNGSFAGTNYGFGSELQARLSSIAGSWREAFLRFDLTTVASADLITAASVRLTGRLSQAGSVTLGLFPVTGAAGWTEGGLTWNNKPTSGTAAIGALKTLTNTANAVVAFDVTSYLKQQKAAGATVVNLAVKATNYTTPYVIFASDEAASGRPELRVTQ
ncbi:MAG: hypothetical protein JWO31_1770 [Phycisphaerales bacterium]|nr:hypothetical protein [Phycisphaerales bacterium]